MPVQGLLAFHSCEDTLFIDFLVTECNKRRMGVATSLLNALPEVDCALIVEMGNHQALSLYKKTGFRRDATPPYAPRSNELSLKRKASSRRTITPLQGKLELVNLLAGDMRKKAIQMTQNALDSLSASNEIDDVLHLGEQGMQYLVFTVWNFL